MCYTHTHMYTYTYIVVYIHNSSSIHTYIVVYSTYTYTVVVYSTHTYIHNSTCIHTLLHTHIVADAYYYWIGRYRYLHIGAGAVVPAPDLHRNRPLEKNYPRRRAVRRTFVLP